ncbi:MAG: hypothetical protein ACRDSR_22820 [Pseudonocardiaceae bacterium]
MTVQLHDVLAVRELAVQSLPSSRRQGQDGDRRELRGGVALGSRALRAVAGDPRNSLVTVKQVFARSR